MCINYQTIFQNLLIARVRIMILMRVLQKLVMNFNNFKINKNKVINYFLFFIWYNINSLLKKTN